MGKNNSLFVNALRITDILGKIKFPAILKIQIKTKEI